jgi:hypothetical protein
MMRLWAEWEEQILGVVESTAGLYGKGLLAAACWRDEAVLSVILDSGEFRIKDVTNASSLPSQSVATHAAPQAKAIGEKEQPRS